MPPKRKILVTSALIYANGTPHLGHMVGTIQSDIWVRLQKLLGHDCVFICGSDAHGTPIMIQAEKLGLTPEAMITEMHNAQLRDFTDFHVDFDNYGSTHEQVNHELVDIVFKRHLDKSNIRKHTITQLYDPERKMFLPDRYIKGECPNCGAQDQYGDNCEVCGKTYLATDLKNPYSVLSGSKPIEKESEHYFFQLEKFTDYLKEWTRKGHLQPEVSNKLDEWFEDGLREWDISRDAPYFGFLIPGEEDKYFYVWLDAPIGYMGSFKSLCNKNKKLDFAEYWDKNSKTELYHFIGKDIIYFHALFWPAMLSGADFRTPTAIFVNGFLTINGHKMSKSRGTFIKARTYLNHLPAEYLRYYFATKLSNRIEDLDLQFDDFQQRVNSDLVGKYINIASRCAGFLTKHFDGCIAAVCSEAALYNEFAQKGDTISELLNKLDYSQAMRMIMQLADKANQYIDDKKPWVLIKDENRKQETQLVCSMGINLFRLLTIYLKPILPETAKKVEAFLNIKPLRWNDKDIPLVNHKICEYKPLLQRIDSKHIEGMLMDSKEDIEKATKAIIEKKPDEKQMPTISMEDFEKIDLRVAKIITAEYVEGADKLLRLEVDVGGETKQIFAGIKSAYKPEELLNRHVVIVANLAPRQMKFGVSEGMVIVAKGQGPEMYIVSPDPGGEAGMKVK